MKKVGYFSVAIIIFLFSLGAVDFWIFRFYQGSIALYNYWIAVALAFLSFGTCLAVAMYISNPEISPKILWGIFLTPFILFVAGIWDWVIYFIYLHYQTPYPPYMDWSAQARWFGNWTMELQLVWTLVCLIILIVMWLKILGKKVKVY